MVFKSNITDKADIGGVGIKAADVKLSAPASRSR